MRKAQYRFRKIYNYTFEKMNDSDTYNQKEYALRNNK